MTQPLYVLGDATAPFSEGPRIIAHICNDVNAWGAGFVLALSARWRKPERQYRLLGMKNGLKLGVLQLVDVDKDLWVANMVAQHGIYAEDGVPPIRYDALESCLDLLGVRAVELGAEVHMPRIGCGLAGGTWPQVETLVKRSLCERDVPVWVYDLPSPVTPR